MYFNNDQKRWGYKGIDLKALSEDLVNLGVTNTIYHATRLSNKASIICERLCSKIPSKKSFEVYSFSKTYTKHHRVNKVRGMPGNIQKCTCDIGLNESGFCSHKLATYIKMGTSLRNLPSIYVIYFNPRLTHRNYRNQYSRQPSDNRINNPSYQYRQRRHNTYQSRFRPHNNQNSNFFNNYRNSNGAVDPDTYKNRNINGIVNDSSSNILQTREIPKSEKSLNHIVTDSNSQKEIKEEEPTPRGDIMDSIDLLNDFFVTDNKETIEEQIPLDILVMNDAFPNDENGKIDKYHNEKRSTDDDNKSGNNELNNERIGILKNKVDGQKRYIKNLETEVNRLEKLSVKNFKKIEKLRKKLEKSKIEKFELSNVIKKVIMKDRAKGIHKIHSEPNMNNLFDEYRVVG